MGLTRYCAGVLALAIGVGGCDTVRHVARSEIDNRGGAFDLLADRGMKADDVQLRILRATLVLGVMTQAARGAQIDDMQRKQIALLVQSIGGTINAAYSCETKGLGAPQARSGSGGSSRSAQAHCYLIDGYMAEVDANLIRMALVTVPIEDARELVSDLLTPDIGDIRALFGLAKKVVVIAHRGLAAYRDALDIYTDAVIEGLPADQSALKEELIKVYGKGTGDLEQWRTALRKVPPGTQITPKAIHFAAALQMIDGACDALHLDKTDKKLCKPATRAGWAKAMPRL